MQKGHHAPPLNYTHASTHAHHHTHQCTCHHACTSLSLPHPPLGVNCRHTRSLTSKRDMPCDHAHAGNCIPPSLHARTAATMAVHTDINECAGCDRMHRNLQPNDRQVVLWQWQHAITQRGGKEHTATCNPISKLLASWTGSAHEQQPQDMSDGHTKTRTPTKTLEHDQAHTC